MSHYTLTRHYMEARAARLLRRVRDDDRGAATAEQIVMIGAERSRSWALAGLERSGE